MEEWEREIITRNLYKLIHNTICDRLLISILTASGVFSDNDVAALNTMNQMEKAAEFYNIIQKRVGGYESLLKGLHETNQTGALDILITIPLDYPNSFRYDENVRLGKGAFSSVYRGEFGSSDVAVKKMSKTNERGRKRIENEVAILKMCENHGNIVQHLHTKKGGRFNLILLELCDFTLKQWVQDNALVQISRRTILTHVTLGLEWLHKQRVVYANLKPENILVKVWPRCFVKICGFGLSMRLEVGEEGCVLALPPVAVYETQGWEAPEVKPPNHHPKYTFASDVYSLGFMYCYVMTNGLNDYGDLGDLNGEEAHILDATTKTMIKKCRVIQIIKRMTSEDPKSRPSCSQLLSLPVLQGNDEGELGNLDEVNHNGEPMIVGLIKKLRKHKAEQRHLGIKIVDELRGLDLTLEINQSRLFTLVESGDLCLIKRGLKFAAGKVKITDIYKEEERNWGRVQVSLLHVAVKCRGYDVVDYLVNEQGFGKVLDKPIFQRTLVHDCIKDIHEVDAERFEQKRMILELLFNKQPSLTESEDWFKRTPLHVATSEKFSNGKQVEFINTVLRANAFVNATDKDGFTPLHLAVYENVPENVMKIIRLLIEHGADPDIQDNSGRTFLHYAAEYVPPHVFHEIIVYLVSIERTASFNTPNQDGWTVLHCAVRYMKGDLLDNTLQLFKTHGVNFNALDRYGESAMFNAIRQARSESFLNSLIRFGGDRRINNINQETALHIAAHWNHLSALKLFISLNFDVNAKNNDGNTPLHYAINCFNSHPSHDVINELVINGADPSLKNKYGESPIELAKQKLENNKMEQCTFDLLLNTTPKT